MIFWGIAIIVTFGVSVALLRPLLQRAAMTQGAENPDINVYRDQLQEIARDTARGTLTEAEANNLHIEISRRMLSADAAAQTLVESSAPSSWLATLIILMVVSLGGLLTYTQIGVPTLPDQPLTARLAAEAERRADRPSQVEAEALVAEAQAETRQSEVNPEQLALVDRLSGILEERPNDLRGHRLLARNLGNLGLFSRAARTQTTVISLLGDAAGSDDYFSLAEYQILAVNGYISPEAEEALADTLEVDPNEPRARYYSGLAAFQAGRADIAYDLWARLLDEGPPTAPWIQAIRSQIDIVALRAGRPVPRGPDTDDIADAEEMSPEDRAAMIEGMVAGLAERLAQEGGVVEEWERLIRAYGVLGETAKASAAWREAEAAFAGDTIALARLRQAAQDAEVAQ